MFEHQSDVRKELKAAITVALQAAAQQDIPPLLITKQWTPNQRSTFLSNRKKLLFTKDPMIDMEV